MLQLILLRHGKAANAIDGQEDYERPLNRKGVVQINQIGQLLKDKGYSPQQIISSSSKRTSETTYITNHYLKVQDVTFEKDLYLAEETHILSQIKEKASCAQILYVGHNFGISNLASVLSGNSISMSTGMIVVFNFDSTTWQDVEAGVGQTDLVYTPNIYLP